MALKNCYSNFIQLTFSSPRKNPSVVIKQEVCSPQFGKTSFPTKESFSANVAVLHPCQTDPGHKALRGREGESCEPCAAV